MTLQEQAEAFLERSDLSSAEWSNAFRSLPKELQETVQQAKYQRHRRSLDTYFVPENAGTPVEHLSPSGAYKLIVTPYSTKKGSWNYTQGLVYAQGKKEPLFEVRRNYSAFPFLWVEDHSNGHSFLVCGEDYQGQTVLELDTGRRRDYVPKEEALGWGFCWAVYKYEAGPNLLVVDGCYWACPYEYRFFDFADPMQGWPELEMGENYAYSDNRWPTIEPDGRIKCYKTESTEDDEEDQKEGPIAATWTFKREGLKLVLVEEWASEKELRDREEYEEGRRKYDEWLSNFRASDPLYLTAKELATDSVFNAQDNIGVGITYEGWCPDFKGNERRITRRIYSKDEGTVDLEWAAETGPIKVVVYKKSSSTGDKFFPHSVEGMKEAFAYAKESVS